MATKLTQKEKDSLKAVGVTGVATVEDARKKLIKYLADNEVDNVDDEPLVDLIGMAEAFYESGDEMSPEEENDALAAEVSDDDEEEEAPEAEEEPEEEEEEEEAPAPVKKPAGKTVPAKKETPAPVKTAAKPAAKTTAKAPVAKNPDNLLFDARNNEDHKDFMAPFYEAFPEEDFEIKILKQGFTIRSLGNNAPLTIFNFDELRIIDNSHLRGNAYFNRLAKVEELEAFLPEELLEQEEIKDGKKVDYIDLFPRGMFRAESHPSIKQVTTDQVLEIFGLSYNAKAKDWEATEDGYYSEAMTRATSTDKKMGDNRQKMEDKLESSKAKTTPKKK